MQTRERERVEWNSSLLFELGMFSFQFKFVFENDKGIVVHSLEVEWYFYKK